LADAIQGVNRGACFIVVGDVVRVQGVCDAEGGGIFVFAKCDEEVVRVWEDGGSANGRESESVVHQDLVGSGK
jgi:hypothetical protein